MKGMGKMMGPSDEEAKLMISILFLSYTNAYFQENIFQIIYFS